MKILITTPSVNAINGGIYILIKWANSLKNIFGHDVTMFTEKKGELKCKWRKLDVPITDEFKGGYYDVIIIGSPHSIWIEDIITSEKCFIFCQMREDLFQPNNPKWYSMCHKFYKSRFPMFSISKWNMSYFEKIGRIAPTYYIGNGLDLNDFPIDVKEKQKVVLIESPETSNPSKDPDHIALRVASEVKRMGYKVLSYGTKPLSLSRYKHSLSQYVQQPSLQEMNALYSASKVLIKATKWDARACAPVECMTKGVVTSRGIFEGDDDLIHNENAVRCNYDFNELKEQTIQLLENQEEWQRLSENAVEYVKTLSWESVLGPVNKVITA